MKGDSRAAGKPLNGQKSEVGDAAWIASDSLVFTQDGSITIGGETGGPGAVAIPVVAKPRTIQADIDAAKSGWVALAFVATANPDGFWDGVQILVTLQPSGDFTIYSDGVKNTVAKGMSNAVAGQKAHVEVTYNPDANTVTVKINGATVADKTSLGAFKPTIAAAGFRFQEPLEANGPSVDNFAIIGAK